MKNFIKCQLTPTNNLTGKTFGEWTVIKLVGKTTHNGAIVYQCKCSCGTIKNIVGTSLTNNDSKSCGCKKSQYLNIANTIHGQYGTPTYRTWGDILSRCKQTEGSNYLYYKKRGISVCNRWKKFENFLEDMGEKPPGKQIDRINNDEGYYKENCRWATPSENANNRRSCHFITMNGITKSMTDWAREFGLPPRVVNSRINAYNWDIKKALTTPVRGSYDKSIN